jgi:chromate transporter
MVLATPPSTTTSDGPQPSGTVPLRQLFSTFLLIGATSFGGGVVAYLRDYLVERRGWLSDEEFLASWEIGQTLPGLIATNVSIIVGGKLRGGIGSIVSVLGVTLPGGVMVFCLGLLYTQFHRNPDVTAILDGAGAAAVGLLLAITMKVGHRQLVNWRDLSLLIPAFFSVGVFHIPLIFVLIVLAPVAIFMHRPHPSAARLGSAHQAARASSSATASGGG